MGIFRRRRDVESTDLDPVGAEASTPAEEQAGEQVAVEADPPKTPALGGPALRGYARPDGPFDRGEVDGIGGRLDLGSLWLAGIPGMELRIEVEQETQALVAVTAVLGESALQLQAFAAPRTAGIWDEIRTEIAAGITGQGGTADFVDGPLGAELQARMPGQGPEGRTVFSPARFLGVDGPRWFLRGVLSGRAAIDPESAGPLIEVLRSTVVVRGDEAMAPRDLLPLRLPEQEPTAGDGQEAAAGGGQEATAGDEQGQAAGRAPSVDQLKPFERGPEITEIR